MELARQGSKKGYIIIRSSPLCMSLFFFSLFLSRSLNLLVSFPARQILRGDHI